MFIIGFSFSVNQADAAPQKAFRSCAALRKAHPQGIAMNRIKARSTGARISASLYRLNRALDTDRDGIACERGERRSAPIVPTTISPATTSPSVTTAVTLPPTTITPATTTTTIPVGSSRFVPHPFGSAVVRPRDGWEIQVVSVISDATSIVLAENMFNDRPGAGGQYFIARVRATYRGTGSDSFGGSFRLRAVGQAGNSYTTFNDSCGVIPSPISSNRTFSGGSVEGNVCWAIASVDASTLVMYDEGFSSSDLAFFALR